MKIDDALLELAHGCSTIKCVESRLEEAGIEIQSLPDRSSGLNECCPIAQYLSKKVGQQCSVSVLVAHITSNKGQEYNLPEIVMKFRRVHDQRYIASLTKRPFTSYLSSLRFFKR